MAGQFLKVLKASDKTPAAVRELLAAVTPASVGQAVTIGVKLVFKSLKEEVIAAYEIARGSVAPVAQVR